MGRNETYGYTAANRLHTASGPWGGLTYGYDSVGNRTSEVMVQGANTTTWTYAYPSNSNKLATVTEGSNVRTFTHDGAGNVSLDDRVGTAYAYRYNMRGRLDQLTVASQVKSDYIYDGLERLAIRTTQNMTPAATTHYVYDRDGRLLMEATDTGATIREYIWLDDMPLAVVADVNTSSPQLWFAHADHIDRPVKMTDGAKAVVWDAVYQPFGEAVTILGSATNNQRFPGQYFLIEAGLHYNWHRHYDPTLGRYLQADPLAFADGPSVYSYARSAPGIYVDPDGNVAWWAAPVALAGINLAWQLYQNGGNIYCVNPWEVASWAASGLGMNRLGWEFLRGMGAARQMGMFREALRTKGNFGMGSASRREASQMGRDWVGPGAKTASDGKTMVSADGLRQYRPPEYKPSLGREQANFEWRSENSGRWTGNGHLDIK